MKKKLILLPMLALLLVGCGEKPIAPTAITVTADKTTLKVDETTRINYAIEPSNADDEVVLSVEKTDILTLTNDIVTAKAVGTSKVFVTSKKHTDIKNFVEITVEAKDAAIVPTSIKLATSTTGSEVKVGATINVTATVLPSGAPQGVSWAVNNEAIATVNSSGVVTGVSAGSVTVTATSTAAASVKASVNLTVKADDPLPAGLYTAMDFSNLTNTTQYGTDKLDVAKATTIFKNASGNKVTAVTAVDTVYSGNGSGGAPYDAVQGLLKWGSGSVIGTLTFTVAANVSKIEVDVAGWTAAEGGEISVNGQKAILPFNNDNDPATAKGLVTLNFAATNTITITNVKGPDAKTCRMRVFGIKLFTA